MTEYMKQLSVFKKQQFIGKRKPSQRPRVTDFSQF